MSVLMVLINFHYDSNCLLLRMPLLIVIQEACVPVCIRVQLHVCVCVCVFSCAVCVHVHVQACMCMCMSPHTSMCVCFAFVFHSHLKKCVFLSMLGQQAKWLVVWLSACCVSLDVIF